MKQGCCLVIFIIFLSACSSGSVGGLWTGASLIYDRHNTYKKINDYRLGIQTNNALFSDRMFKTPESALDVAVFHGDILVSGHLWSEQLLEEARHRLSTVKGYRRLFNEIKLKNAPANSMQDTWITTRIRSQIFADDSIDPTAFKIVTSDSVVYLMGDVKQDEAEKVIYIARRIDGVERVVTLLKYFTYKSRKSMA